MINDLKENANKQKNSIQSLEREVSIIEEKVTHMEGKN